MARATETDFFNRFIFYAEFQGRNRFAAYFHEISYPEITYEEVINARFGDFGGSFYIPGRLAPFELRFSYGLFERDLPKIKEFFKDVVYDIFIWKRKSKVDLRLITEVFDRNTHPKEGFTLLMTAKNFRITSISFGTDSAEDFSPFIIEMTAQGEEVVLS